MSKAGKISITAIALVALLMLGAAGYYLLYFRVATVPVGSMANTLIRGDRVLCDLRGGEVKRGDIVLFKMPDDQKVMFIKRVVGLPGERIQVRGTRVYINDQELPEARTFVNSGDGKGVLEEISSEGGGPYRVYYDKREDRNDELSIITRVKFGVIEEYQIPQGHYFLLGDSRDNSFDSRSWGTVPRELIVGKALMVVDSESEGNEERFFKPIK